ncbi:hypothetical protein NLJ89_g8450 [Agrocybe chaxingu]|uniref:Copper transport protein n=1 Tax=Agrocybe chaxingu TaxID=84603 RepID=A0A9W8JVB5_9AGAR|nr:hypothetical protein NLJ89_g8450 [Agrocybe chaxingu]
MDHSGHTSSTTSTPTASHSGMMIPYLHFFGGDNLFFETWRPSSTGALAGACIGLVLLALLERWLAATRSVFDAHWQRRAQTMTAARDGCISSNVKKNPSSGRDSTTKSLVAGDVNIQEAERERSEESHNSNLVTVRSRLRTITPFIATHDIPRGVLYALQMLLGYGLMLAVMTYQAAYIISIVVGLGHAATMIFSTFALLLCLFGAANAHFRLLYPLPRGNFVADLEPNFCGGYTEVTTNRTTFPLSGGFFRISTGHPDWAAGVLVSTVPNPNNFDNFSVNGVQQLVKPFAREADAGSFCIPLNLTEAGVAGVQDGANVTIQVVFDGGDGLLYQCADLTLSAALTSPPEDVTCSNASATTSASSPTATTSTGAALGLSHEASGFAAVVLSLAGVIAAVL